MSEANAFRLLFPVATVPGNSTMELTVEYHGAAFYLGRLIIPAVQADDFMVEALYLNRPLNLLDDLKTSPEHGFPAALFGEASPPGRLPDVICHTDDVITLRVKNRNPEDRWITAWVTGDVVPDDGDADDEDDDVDETPDEAWASAMALLHRAIAKVKKLRTPQSSSRGGEFLIGISATAVPSLGTRQIALINPHKAPILPRHLRVPADVGLSFNIDKILLGHDVDLLDDDQPFPMYAAGATTRVIKLKAILWVPKQRLTLVVTNTTPDTLNFVGAVTTDLTGTFTIAAELR